MPSGKASTNSRRGKVTASASSEPSVAPDVKKTRAARATQPKTKSSSVTSAKSHRKFSAAGSEAAGAAAASVPAPQQRLLHEEIAMRAYFYWLERGAHHGSAHEDWVRAVRDLSGER